MDAISPASPNPREDTSLVVRHCAIKGLQAGSLIGAGIGLPVALFWQKTWAPSQVLSTMGRYSFIASGLGGIVMTGVAVYMTSSSTEERNHDRAYRLRWNYNQNRVDMYSGVGGAIGGIGGALLTKSVLGFTRGGALGLAAAVLVHASTIVPPKDIPEGYH